jgi:hypothetical protein
MYLKHVANVVVYKSGQAVLGQQSLSLKLKRSIPFPSVTLCIQSVDEDLPKQIMSLGRVCLTVTPSQFEERKAFYTDLLSVLNYKNFRSGNGFFGLSNASGIPDFFLIAMKESERGPTKNVHIGFRAPDRETVNKFHATAL